MSQAQPDESSQIRLAAEQQQRPIDAAKDDVLNAYPGSHAYEKRRPKDSRIITHEFQVKKRSAPGRRMFLKKQRKSYEYKGGGLSGTHKNETMKRRVERNLIGLRVPFLRVGSYDISLPNSEKQQYSPCPWPRYR